MTAINCHQCGRPTSASGRRCIWCDAQIFEGATVEAFDTTTVDAEYVEGIERLNEAGPVRLVFSSEGIEIVEILPGSRTVKIPARSILEASVAHLIEPEKPTEQTRWRNAIGQFRVAFRRPMDNGEKACDYIITIKYEDGDEMRTAVFKRSDHHGLVLARRLAGILETLTRER